MLRSSSTCFKYFAIDRCVDKYFARKTDALVVADLLLETCICTLNKLIKSFNFLCWKFFLILKHYSKAATLVVLYEKLFQKSWNIQRKTPVLKFLFNKVAGLHDCCSGSSRLEVFCEKILLRNFSKFTGKHLCQSLFFNKVAGLLRTPFFIEHLRRLLLLQDLSFTCTLKIFFR